MITDALKASVLEVDTAFKAAEFERFKMITVALFAQKTVKEYGPQAQASAVECAVRWANGITTDDPLFGVWLAAKHDAKPVADVFLRQTHVGNAWTYANACGGMTFKSKELAQQHAIANGFRLE